MQRLFGTSLVLTACVASALAQGGPPPTPPPGPGPVTTPVPPQNPITVDKAALGKVLFWDEQLSSTGTTACGTCHIPAAGGADPRVLDANIFSTHPGADSRFGTPDDVQASPGVPRTSANGQYVFDPAFRLDAQVTGRTAPSAINAGAATRLFWDGRAEGPFADPLTGTVLIPVGGALENQALGPPLSGAEMAHESRDWTEVLTRLQNSKPLDLAADVPLALEQWIADRTYAELFEAAFGDDELTAGRVAMAIATYERTLLSDETPDDQARNGTPTALTPLEAQGKQLFYDNQIGCAICHSGVFFADNQFHYTGVTPAAEDPGRFAVTGNPQNLGMLRTPGLRNVGLRGPFFHNGSAQTLEEVVAFYNRGGDFNAPNKAPAIRPLGLSPQQQSALVAYLRNGLTDDRVAQESPPFDRVTLFSDDPTLAGTLYGTATPGTGGVAPKMVCHEPPSIGNPSFTLAVSDALGGARAFLMITNRDVPGGVPFRGATSFVSSSSGRSRLLSAGNLAGIGNGQGYGSLSLSLPSSSSDAGVQLYAQWFVIDPAAAGGVSASEAVRFTLY